MRKHNRSLIYLDHNATTPIDRAVADNIIECMNEDFGNPSSGYPLGIRAKEKIETARAQVAAFLGCKSSEVVFTSGGSESNNMVIKGLIDFRKPGNHHIIISAVEHPAILNPALYCEEMGVRLTVLPVDHYGIVSLDDLQKSIKSDTRLISIMLANNETGTLQPIKEVARIAKEYGVPLHTDAAQAVGKIPVDVNELGVDLLTVAGHKFYGPKGVGALFIREGLNVTPLIHGAGQETGKRAGTENVALASGLGTACGVAQERLKDDIHRIKALRDRLQELLFENIEGLVLNGHLEERLPNTLNISVPDVEGSKILEGLSGLAASTGAACHDRSTSLSHVLSAMKVTPEIGMGALRLSLGRGNDIHQIETAAAQIITRVREIKALG